MSVRAYSNYYLTGSLSGVFFAVVYVFFACPCPSVLTFPHRPARGFRLLAYVALFVAEGSVSFPLFCCTKTNVSFGRTSLVATSSEAPTTRPACYIPGSLKPCFLLSRSLRFPCFSVCAAFRDVLCLLLGSRRRTWPQARALLTCVQRQCHSNLSCHKQLVMLCENN